MQPRRYLLVPHDSTGDLMPSSRRNVLQTLSGGITIAVAGCSTNLGAQNPAPATTKCPGVRGLVQLTNQDDTAHELGISVIEQPNGPTVFEDSVEVSPGQSMQLEAYDLAGSFDVDVRLTDTGEEASGSVYSSPTDCTQTKAVYRITSSGEPEYQGSVMLE